MDPHWLQSSQKYSAHHPFELHQLLMFITIVAMQGLSNVTGYKCPESAKRSFY